MDVDGTAERAAAGGVGRDGVWQARARDAVNAPAIMVRPKNRDRVIADFQDRGLTGLLALTGGMEHVFVIVLTSFVVRLEVSSWPPAKYPMHLATSYHDQLEVIRVLTPTRGRATTLILSPGYPHHFRSSNFGPQI